MKKILITIFLLYNFFTIEKTKAQAASQVINNSGVGFTVTGCTGNSSDQTITIFFTFSNTQNADHHIDIAGNFVGAGVSMAVDGDGNQFPFKNSMLAGTVSQGLIEKEIPAGLILKGSITYSNVFSKINTIALAKMAILVKNWSDGKNHNAEMILFKNVKVDWSGLSTEYSNEQDAPKTQSRNTTVNNLNKGLNFAVTDCKGDANLQTVTIFYTLSNPRKSNQKIEAAVSLIGVGTSIAFDNEGEQFPVKAVMLGGTTGNYLVKELPTGLQLKGSITFSNVLSTINGFAVTKILIATSNWDGGDNRVAGMVEVKNVAIDWGGPAPKIGADYLSYNELLTNLNNGDNMTHKKVIIDNIYFQTNEDIITDNSKPALQNILRLLTKYPKLKVSILGHTDNVGRDDDNQILSFSRAKAVVSYLVAKGIYRDRLSYTGYGSTVPIADNSTAEGRAKNRRTEMEITEQ